jgi:hypothetical protein
MIIACDVITDGESLNASRLITFGHEFIIAFFLIVERKNPGFCACEYARFS